MKVERSLQVNMAMLTVTSALLYGMGQRDLRLALLVMVASAAAIWLTDVKQWFRLNRFTASILAMGVFLMVVGRMFSWNNLMSIRAIANLLVYLQIILLFQRKDGRVYWQLIVLSLLLLVVSTVFNQGALFGLLMVAYLYMAISAMALLFLYHEEKRYVPVEPIADESADATDPRRAWPLGTRESFFLGDAARRQDPAGRPGRDFLRRLVGMGVGTLLFTAVVFFAMPRFGQTAWRSPFHQQRRMVGYSGKVELGDLGRVSEDPAEVLRIEFTDPGTGRMVPMDGAVYLHGTVLTRYEGRCWTLPHPRDTPRRLRVVAPPRGETVVQTVTIEPMDRAEVFCVQPFFTVEKQFNLWFDPVRQSLCRATELCDQQYRFQLRTQAFRKGHQKSLVPALREPNDDADLLQTPGDALPTLVRLAERWMAELPWSQRRIFDRARHLESKLRYSDQFRYSLKTQRTDGTIDPIEDFVKNNPQGHCEYFATTLALMLRGQGIPARLVVGYKCDEFNPLGKYFQVRQLHAHTWVEVYLPPDQVPPRDPSEPDAPGRWARGAWLRLDPTPGSDAEDLSATGRLFATAGRGIDWLEYAWNSYVMEMNRSRQRDSVYRPLIDWAEGTYERLTSLEWWKQTGRDFLALVDPRNWQIDKWFSWRGGLVGVIVCFVLLVVYRAARGVVRRVRRWLDRRRRRIVQAARTRVEFYQRFQSLVRRRGMRRAVGQTHREFARAVGGRLALEPGGVEWSRLPGEITEAFYEVRFGGRPLDNTRQEAVERALSRLEEALDRRRRARRRGKETMAS